ncbi:hypothetical protein JCM10207_003984 [Rhodosporidiobolus poonsookiae]
MTDSSKLLTLITGASGFVGAATALTFLEKGHAVRLPLRSQAQIDAWKAAHPQYSEKMDLVLLEGDMAAEGTFDDLVQGCEAVVHTASPASFTFKTSAEEEILKPAVNGVLSLLASASKAKSVKSVVITSSMQAYATNAELDELRFGKELVFDENTYHGITYEEAATFSNERGHDIYSTSKRASDLAAFDYVTKHKPSFGLTIASPSFVIGANPAPVVKHFSDLRTNVGIWLGTVWEKKEFPPQDGSVFRPIIWVSIADVALAHFLAATNPAVAGGKRYALAGGVLSTEQLVRAIVHFQPGLKGKFPALPEHEVAGEVLVVNGGFKTEMTEKDLGIKWESFEAAVEPFAKQLYDLAKADGKV